VIFASWPVSRVLSGGCPPRRPFIWGWDRSQPLATNPGGGLDHARSQVSPRPCRPYSVLLPVGFAVPSPLPETRCALTAPFHPYPCEVALAQAVCFLLHFPWGRPRRPLAATVDPWSPDFPPPGAQNATCAAKPVRPAAAVRPAGTRNKGVSERQVKRDMGSDPSHDRCRFISDVEGEGSDPLLPLVAPSARSGGTGRVRGPARDPVCVHVPVDSAVGLAIPLPWQSSRGGEYQCVTC
jgi:hypothetical protein